MTNTSVKKYPRYKDSGIAWIGKIPAEWHTIKFKYCFLITGGNGFSEFLQGNNSGEIPFCKCSDINDTYKIFVDRAKNYISKKCCIDNNFNLIPANSILIAKIGEALKKNHRKINSLPCCIDNNMEAFTLKRNDNNLYYFYVLNCVDMLWFDNGGTIPSVNNEKLKNFKLPWTTKFEQQVIVDYLDEKCGAIDKTIETEEKVIEKLKEYKQSLITETVTKGLDKSVPMKDSGIAWIGSIPEGWKVLRHKYILRKVKEICEKYNGEDIISLTMKGVIKRDLDNPMGKMPLTFDGYQKIYAGNLLLCLFDIDVTPRCVGLIKDNGLTSPAYSQFKFLGKDSPQYYTYLLTALDDDKCLLHLSKNLRSSLSEDSFGAILTIQPPLKEQQAIADYLDDKCAKIDKAIADKEQVIEKLTEYKKSLIYECVTGKRMVA